MKITQTVAQCLKLSVLFAMAALASSGSYAMTPFTTDFSGNTLPAEFTWGGGSGSSYTVADGLTLSTNNLSGTQYYRSYIATSDSNYLWAGHSGPLHFGFSLAADFSPTAIQEIMFYLVGDGDSRIGGVSTDNNKASVIGIVLKSDGSGNYTVNLQVKGVTANDSGFSGSTFTKQSLNVSGDTRTFAFVIEDNAMTLVAGDASLGTAISLGSVAGDFSTYSRLYVAILGNPNTGLQNVEFSEVSVAIPEGKATTVVLALAAASGLLLRGIVARRKKA